MTKQTIQLFLKALTIGVLLNVGFGFVTPTIDAPNDSFRTVQPASVYGQLDTPVNSQ